MKRRILKNCERCKKEFVCGLFGCWCSEIEVTDTLYSNIVAQYHDCLCPSCLSQITGKCKKETEPHFSLPDISKST